MNAAPATVKEKLGTNLGTKPLAKSTQKSTQKSTTKPTINPIVKSLSKSTTKPTAKSFPFRNPVPLRSSNWDEEHVSPDHMHMLISGPEKTSLEEILRRPSIPVLCITGTLYREIRYIVEAHPASECAMFLTLKRMDANRPHFLAFDMFMPGQDVSGGSVSLDSEDCEKYFKALSEVPYYKEKGLHRHICHLHSHGRNGIFWSGTDDTQQLTREDLGFMDDFRFYMVVNSMGGIKCSFVNYFPVLHRVDAAVVISFAEEEHIQWLTRARKKELDALMKDVMYSRITNFAVPDAADVWGIVDSGRNGMPGIGTGSETDSGINTVTTTSLTPFPDLNHKPRVLLPHPNEEEQTNQDNILEALHRINNLLGLYSKDNLLPYSYIEATCREYDSIAFAYEIGFDVSTHESDRTLAALINIIIDEIGNTTLDSAIDEYVLEIILGEYVRDLVEVLQGDHNFAWRFNHPSEETIACLLDAQVRNDFRSSTEFKAMVTNDLVQMYNNAGLCINETMDNTGVHIHA